MGNDKDVKDSAQSLLSRPILVPLDGTDVAEGILPYVSEVAKKGNVPLLLLGVVDPRGIHYPPTAIDRPAGEISELGAGGVTVDDPASRPAGETSVLYRDQIENAAMANVLEKLDAVAGGLREKGITVSVRSSIGSPAEEVLRVAEEEGCGIIAMSTHGRNAITRGILGSVTDRVVHASTLPVLTVTPERAKEYLNLEGASLRTVMVPLDGSDLSERALPYAVELARSLSLELLLVRAVTLDSSSDAYGGYFDLHQSQLSGGPRSHGLPRRRCRGPQASRGAGPVQSLAGIGPARAAELCSGDAERPHRDDDARAVGANTVADGQCR